MNLFNLLLNAYGSHGPSNDIRILELSRLFIEHCANINYVHEGYAPIHGAILANSPAVVRHLVEAGADLSVKVSRPGRKADGLTPEQLVLTLAAAGKVKPEPLLAALRAQPLPSVKATSCGKPQSAPTSNGK